jgi:hypothetical protein
MAEVIPFATKRSFNELTKNVPDGKWVALSRDETRLIAEGDTLAQVTSEAQEERRPVFYRIRR